MARRLVLVKHALPIPDPSVAAAQWQLGAEGAAQAARLATALEAFAPYALFSSTEDKARQTAELIGPDIATDARLREIHRPVLPWMGQEEHARFNRRLFDDRNTAVVGDESARDALERFGEAIAEHVAAADTQNILVVTHGTVIALFVAAHNHDVDPFALWQQLQCADYAVLSLPDYRRLP